MGMLSCYLTKPPKQSWAVNEADMLRIDALGQWCLRGILGFEWSDFVRSGDVRHAARRPPLSSVVEARRLSLFGRVARVGGSTDAGRVLFGPPSGVWGGLADGRTVPGAGLLLMTWQTPALGFRKQERQLRTGSTGGCLCNCSFYSVVPA